MHLLAGFVPHCSRYFVEIGSLLGQRSDESSVLLNCPAFLLFSLLLLVALCLQLLAVVLDLAVHH